MGLLEEAIKEHLELKRRRGADPGELLRLEREALGGGEEFQSPVQEGAAAAPDSGSELSQETETVEIDVAGLFTEEQESAAVEAEEDQRLAELVERDPAAPEAEEGEGRRRRRTLLKRISKRDRSR
jgi:hypothetical protein